MLLALVVLAVLGILLGAAALATWDGVVLRDPHPDDRGATLPATALQPEDVLELRFDLALRGYRMAEVDAAMSRLAAELAARDSRIVQLEQALVDEPEPEAVEPVAEEPVVSFAPLEPPAAAPAVISGPLTATTWVPAPVSEQPPVSDVASAQVDIADAPVEQTQEEEDPEPEPSAAEPSAVEEAEAASDDIASAQVDMADAPVEQTQEEEPDEAQPEAVADDVADDAASAQADIADAPGERTQGDEELTHEEELTLPASDEAFSFPELQLPDAAAADAPEATDDAEDLR